MEISCCSEHNVRVSCHGDQNTDIAVRIFCPQHRSQSCRLCKADIAFRIGNTEYRVRNISFGMFQTQRNTGSRVTIPSTTN